MNTIPLHPSHPTERGFSLLEMLLAVAIMSLLMAALGEVLIQSSNAERQVDSRLKQLQEARFAMERMVEAVGRAPRLLLPLADNPATNWREQVREQRLPPAPPEGSSVLASAVLAVTLDPAADRDGNAVADADNDGDLVFDEDLPADNQRDGAPGIVGIDDDGDGLVDEAGGGNGDDDEDGSADEDWMDGSDNDADGSLDEDTPSDMNNDSGTADDDGDGLVSEDWLDPVVFYLAGGTLMERRPTPWDENGDAVIDGRDYTESPIAEGVSFFRVERLPRAASDRAQLLDLTLTVADGDGPGVTLHTQVRVGGRL